MKLEFFDFYKLGHESHTIFKNYFAQTFIKYFGPLGINAKIRSAHVLNNFLEMNISRESKVNTLDVGCGVAYVDIWLARKYPNWNIIGIDIDSSAINKANIIKESYSLTNVMFEQKNILELNLSDTFDIIYSMDVLEHIYDDLTALKNIQLALKKGGKLILHLPLRYSLNFRLLPGFLNFKTIDHVRPEYTYKEICEKLLSTGFVIEKHYFSYSVWGELAFELNYLFWRYPKIRMIFAFLSHFFSNILGYIDLKKENKYGNGLVIRAIKK